MVVKKTKNQNQFGDLLGEIANQMAAFHASEIAIAEAVLLDPKSAANMNISQLAQESGT